MSWQATAWAVRQNVGHPSRKLLLLVMANYADEHGVCWPSQERLAGEAEMSLDTVQRQTKKLEAQGLIATTRPPKRRGQWQTIRYQLRMSDDAFKPQNAARSQLTLHRLQGQPDGNCGAAKPQPEHQPDRAAVRLKPSIEPLIEPSIAAVDARARATGHRPTGNPYVDDPKAKSAAIRTDAAARLRAFQAKQEGIEVTQDRIAKRVCEMAGGIREGWSLLMQMPDRELERITTLERRRQLDDETLRQAVLGSRLVQPS